MAEQTKEHPFFWLAMSMALAGKSCVVCGHTYDCREDVDAHEPMKGYDDDIVGKECWDKYLELRKSGK